MTPAVSIITPIYNAAPFLGEAIESVVAQRGANWEMILVDDGSTDDSAFVARRYCARDPRILLLMHEGGRNLGSSASRNLAISHAQGEVIAFLDADDTWMPGKLQSQLAVLRAYPEVAMIYSAAQRWYSWDLSRPDAKDFVVPAYIPGIGTDTVIAPPELLRAYIRDESATPCTCTAMVRRESVLPAGAFEESFPGLYDDQVFYAKICLQSPVFVQSACLARYRQHDNSCCATARRLGTGDDGRVQFLNWLRAYSSFIPG